MPSLSLLQLSPCLWGLAFLLLLSTGKASLSFMNGEETDFRSVRTLTLFPITHEDAQIESPQLQPSCNLELGLSLGSGPMGKTQAMDHRPSTELEISFPNYLQLARNSDDNYGGASSVDGRQYFHTQPDKQTPTSGNLNAYSMQNGGSYPFANAVLETGPLTNEQVPHEHSGARLESSSAHSLQENADNDESYSSTSSLAVIQPSIHTDTLAHIDGAPKHHSLTITHTKSDYREAQVAENVPKGVCNNANFPPFLFKATADTQHLLDSGGKAQPVLQSEDAPQLLLRAGGNTQLFPTSIGDVDPPEIIKNLKEVDNFQFFTSGFLKRKRTQEGLEEFLKLQAPRNAQPQSMLFQYVGSGREPVEEYSDTFTINPWMKGLYSSAILQSGKLETRRVRRLKNSSRTILPNPLWPHPRAMAIASNGIITLRPFRFWTFPRRKHLLSADNDVASIDFKLVKIAVERIVSLIPNEKKIPRITRLKCPTLPIVLKRSEEPSIKNWLMILGKDGILKATGLVKNRAAAFFKTILLFQDILLTKLSQTPNAHKIRQEFWSWLIREVFEPQNSLPVFGTVNENLEKLEARRFDAPQKLFIHAVAADSNHEVDEPAALSILTLWYKNYQPVLWKKLFESDDEFMFRLTEKIVSIREAHPLNISFLC
ncbi:hypothetical protein O181_031834 [Austropuccinia psidii MF-1]|uniref:Uncharacterized protein n=1 Tax=Austropuccinia psidii MF-1 TaxID=1389203 RepID=A0A9Q3CVP1_9BASI|nr:hypothetical protein [Austropuccinia psidii MF-1]